MITRRNFIKKSLFTTALGSISINNNLYAKSTKYITTPMLKVNGAFESISWEEAFNLIEIKINSALKESGVNGVSLFTDANISVEESYAFTKLFKAGFRSNNISTSSYNSEEIHLKSRTIVYGINAVSGTFNDILNSDYTFSFDADISKLNFKKNIKYINITTENKYDKNAILNITIKKSSYSYLINYLIREKIKVLNKNDIKYLKKHFVFANFKENNQWEISLKNYKKSLEKYNLEYVIDNISSSSKQDKKMLESNILKLRNIFLKKNNKIISLTSSIFNKSTNSLETNLLLQSLHLFFDKHSRPGCGVFNISDHISQGSLDEVGLYSNRLPANMYIKYKKHRKKAEDIFNVVEGTLNPVSYTHTEFINNIKNNITKFLWITNDNSSFINNINTNDIFILSSSNNINKSNNNCNLILPTAINNTRTSITISEDRAIKYNPQNNIPKGLSMSLLWQIMEVSKKIKIKSVYKKVKVDKKQALKNLLAEYVELGYSEDDNLYKILFYNSKLRLFDKSYGLNTEMNADYRKMISSDGGIDLGCRYNIQEYLFNEYRQFTLLNAHDINRYDFYVNSKYNNYWPIYNNKSIKYRFNPIDDIYARTSLKDNRSFSFYGKMGKKNLPFGNLKKITNEKTNKKTFKYRAKIFTCNITNS